jgi:hypothetical protein
MFRECNCSAKETGSINGALQAINSMSAEMQLLSDEKGK